MAADKVVLDPESSYHNPKSYYTTQDHFITIATMFCNREILNLFGHDGMV